MTTPQQSFSSYEDFFVFYLREHSDRHNRWMHAAGTTLGIGVAIAAFAVGHPWYALGWPVVSYAFAWTGHFVMEGNKPATFGHPFWSLISDFRMVGLMFTGRLKARIEAGTRGDARRSD
ncbi:MAG TPA: DUF962 domain-containing protein [Alphaproteobacteria bacterium]|nr:DUF962 domain-containing protein [Alphaproteobacteria bacterium]